MGARAGLAHAHSRSGRATRATVTTLHQTRLETSLGQALNDLGAAFSSGKPTADGSFLTDGSTARATEQVSTRRSRITSFSPPAGLRALRRQCRCQTLPMRAIAVDWSGRRSGASEFIWRADVEDGHLLRLEMVAAARRSSRI